MRQRKAEKGQQLGGRFEHLSLFSSYSGVGKREEESEAGCAAFVDRACRMRWHLG